MITNSHLYAVAAEVRSLAKKKFHIRPVSKVFMISILLALIVFAGITSYSAYAYQRDRILLQCESALHDVFDLYYDKVYSLSDLYVPVFQSEKNEGILRSYFARSGDQRLEYAERIELAMLLNNMMSRDGDIHFIALYNPDAAHNYCLTVNSSTLRDMWTELPALSDDSGSRQQLLGQYEWQTDYDEVKNSFVIQGGGVPAGSKGKIFIGYDLTAFDKVLRRKEASSLATFIVTNETGLIYDSSGSRYDQTYDMGWLDDSASVVRDPEGYAWFSGVLNNTGRVFSAAYLVPWNALVRLSHVYTPFILLILANFTLFAMSLYGISAKRIFRRVEGIQEGLAVLGENQLGYRLSVSGSDDEFDEIAEHINAMAARLKGSIEKEYELRVRETAAELNQIQARFDPHFLYNTLEIIRVKLFSTGDQETADYIDKLSRIFRNLTDAATVMSLREEIAFCSLYVSLLQLRFHDAVEVSYYIDAELQECGILAHLIQPAIENYFMHALDETTDGHNLDITCDALAEDSIRITIADNGTGSDDARIAEVNRRLLTPAIKDRGYGLMSIAKRIRLFYGEGYGVHLEKNEPEGMRVIITIPRMSVETHCRKLGISD